MKTTGMGHGLLAAPRVVVELRKRQEKVVRRVWGVVGTAVLFVTAGCGTAGQQDYPAEIAKSAPLTTTNPNRDPVKTLNSGSATSDSVLKGPGDVSAERVSNRPANPNGQVLIIEYHHVRDGKGDMFRSTAEFKKDLERLHRMGFRPCNVSDYLEGKFPIPSGASPVVFTFDDSNPSQFQLLEDGTVDPESAVGIWMEFAKSHPDFPVRATWYVLPNVMWSQPKWVDRKIEMLREMGSELGSHTVTHSRLDRMSDEKVKADFAEAIDRLEALGQPSPVSLALPFGISPENKSLLKAFEFKGKKYEMKGAMLVGANPAPSPTSEKLNRYRIPRIISYGGEMGIDYWLDQVEKGNVKPYVAE